ncbi:arginyl-tRNA synthetase [Talaromyces proteolyticus]|uniref:arginine--tRNA ligase n=1 Tax=Talaromyces proteolyticus TaxID=1131652 RepID=A0AAD4L055_9EURO|nr:arginyl-tRNA synthetase [Talaromyces proteolyticus]KAH8704242.1 arginyl-tRNA synthetase [Talaromyces proteolyticus]
MGRSNTLNNQGLETLLQNLEVDGPLPVFPSISSYPLENPMDIYRLYLTHATNQIIECDSANIYDSLQRPTNASKCDLTLVVPRLGIRVKKPDEFAVEIASKFPKSPLFTVIPPSGIWVPVSFSPKTLPLLLLPYVFDREKTYGWNLSYGLKYETNISTPRKKVVVEFSSPNIAKEFHAGHLRSTIIGAFISNLYESMGWDVVKVNYLGDWGKQFGLLAVGWQRYGSEELFKQDPLGHLLDIYARINREFKPEQDASRDARDKGLDTEEIESKGLYAERNYFFKRMENGDEEALTLWRRFRDVSIERYISTYARLNITFDEYSGESQVQSSTTEKVERILQENGICEEDNGSSIINFKKHGAPKLASTVIRNRTGTTTYLLRDVGAVLERAEKYDFDKMIYVVSAEQDLYFQRLFKTVELMGFPELASKLLHINFGKVQGMSSRMGTVRLLSDILNESGKAMHELMKANEVKYAQVENPKDISDIIGITAVMVQDMSGKRVHNYPFDMTRMTSFEGDTGPYLQYAHARLSSIIRKTELGRDDLANADFSYLEDNQHVTYLLRLIAQWPDVVATALKNHEPSTILTYLFNLTHQISSSYDIVKVVNAPEGPDVTRARASLFEAARQVLNNGMRLLGITPVDRYILPYMMEPIPLTAHHGDCPLFFSIFETSIWNLLTGLQNVRAGNRLFHFFKNNTSRYTRDIS